MQATLTPPIKGLHPCRINRENSSRIFAGQPLTRTLRFALPTASENDGLLKAQPVRDEIPLWPTRASDPGATQDIVCAAPPVPVAQPAVGSVTAYTPGNPGGILPASRSTTERRLPRSPAREAPQQEHAKKKPRGTNPAASTRKRSIKQLHGGNHHTNHRR